MKTKILVAITFLILWQRVQGQGFVNLDFESANVPDVPSGQFGANVTPANGMPGWTAYFNGSQTTAIGHNNLSIGGGGIFIQGPHWDTSQILAGSYTALLEGSTAGGPVSAAIGQTGQVPVNTLSLTFLLSLDSSLQVSFNGQIIPLVQTGSTPNYDIMGGDISAFAGQTGELLFTALPGTQLTAGGGLLDNIQFSPTAIPEPSEFALGALGALILGFRRWRKSP